MTRQAGGGRGAGRRDRREHPVLRSEDALRREHPVLRGEDAVVVIDTDLVLLAMGFVGPTDDALVTGLGIARDARGMAATDDAHRTSVGGVFAAGDVRRGASLIVWAIREGRDAAAAMHAYLNGNRA